MIHKRQKRSGSERGIALIIAVFMLVGLTGLAMATIQSSGMGIAEARAVAGTLGRSSCQDQVARYLLEQLDREDLIPVLDAVNQGTCTSSAVGWVNYGSAGIPPGPDGTTCLAPTPSCNPDIAFESTTLTYDACPQTRAIALVAPTPYTPGGEVVGDAIGDNQGSSSRRIPVRIMVADLETCDQRSLNSYLDVAYVMSFTVSGTGDSDY